MVLRSHRPLMTWTILKVILLALGGTVVVTAGIFLSEWIADAMVPSKWSWRKILALVLFLAIGAASGGIRTLVIELGIVTALGLLVMFLTFRRMKEGDAATSLDKKEMP